MEHRTGQKLRKGMHTYISRMLESLLFCDYYVGDLTERIVAGPRLWGWTWNGYRMVG